MAPDCRISAVNPNLGSTVCTTSTVNPNWDSLFVLAAQVEPFAGRGVCSHGKRGAFRTGPSGDHPHPDLLTFTLQVRSMQHAGLLKGPLEAGRTFVGPGCQGGRTL